jgi:hypothetical protein
MDGSFWNFTLLALFIKLLLFSLLSAFYEKFRVLIKFASDDLFIPQFLSLLFDFPPNSRGTSAHPSLHTSVPRHTG